MRYIKDVLLEKVVLHVIDTQADEAIITEKLLTVTEDLEEFARKHILKSLNDDETMTSRFYSNETETSQAIYSVIEDSENFLDVSQKLSEKLFNIIRNTDIPSGDLLFVQYIADEQRCFGIMKLDYQLSFMHNIQFEEEAIQIKLISQEVGLPGLGQRLKKCAFFTKSADDFLDIIVLDKKQKMEAGKEDYFVKDFLDVVKVSDDTDKTRKFRATVEKWAQKNLADQIDVANEIRNVVDETLINDSQVSIPKLTDNMATPELKDSFADAVKEAGYTESSQFEVDKTWVEKKMKSKQIKTDTGVVIKGDFDVFKDSQRFVVRQNGDGTVDYIIKGVRNVIER